MGLFTALASLVDVLILQVLFLLNLPNLLLKSIGSSINQRTQLLSTVVIQNVLAIITLIVMEIIGTLSMLLPFCPSSANPEGKSPFGVLRCLRTVRHCCSYGEAHMLYLNSQSTFWILVLLTFGLAQCKTLWLLFTLFFSYSEMKPQSSC